MPRLSIALCCYLAASSAADEVSTCAGGSCAEAGEPTYISLVQKSARIDRTHAQGVALGAAGSGGSMAARDLATLRSDPFQRVWFVCKGSPPQPKTEQMEEAEVDVEDAMMCTAEMTFEGLCCAPWATGLDYSQKVLMSLKSEQKAASGAAALLHETNETVIKLCTEQSAGGVIAGSAPARMPFTCREKTFTEAQLAGDSEVGPGEAILRARLNFFLDQGIPMDVIPKCSEKVSSCPDGSAPAVVKDAWVQEMSLLQQGGKRFSGALFTSGSFSLSFGLY